MLFHIIFGHSVLKISCDMKYLIIFLFWFLAFIFEGCLCGEKEGICEYQSQYKIPVYGYIESGAPYRNPFYIHFEDSFNCSEIIIMSNRKHFKEIGINFYCGHDHAIGRPCKFIRFESKDIIRFEYWPFEVNNNCKEWTGITKYHTDYQDYIFLLGCENGHNNTHYIGLWIFIRSRSVKSLVTKIEKEIEEQIKAKVHQIIDSDYNDIKHDIILVPDWGEHVNCKCRDERQILQLNGEISCQYERLDTCVPKETISANLFTEYGKAILGIISIILLVISAGYEICCAMNKILSRKEFN